MKPNRKRHTLAWAIFLAVSLHLLLFMAVRPADGDGLTGLFVPPETCYLSKSSAPPLHIGSGIRSVGSPILFSLPSKLGFSRDLMEETPHNRLTPAQPAPPESFIQPAPSSSSTEAHLDPDKLMVSAGTPAAPRAPAGVFKPRENRPAAPRVYVAPKLKERLEGGIVLPPELNEPGTSAWEIRADISISKQGTIRHVFLEQPLEAAPLNNSIIQLLYGLRFKAGEGSVEGRIEIYSPPAEGTLP